LHIEITILKRTINEAESSGNLEIKLAQCQSRKEDLDDEIERLKE
jgi:hypothetical protein